MSGHECYHCKQWVEEGEAHDCWTTTEAALTADLSEDLREAWERLRETATEFGGRPAVPVGLPAPRDTSPRASRPRQGHRREVHKDSSPLLRPIEAHLPRDAEAGGCDGGIGACRPLQTTCKNH